MIIKADDHHSFESSRSREYMQTIRLFMNNRIKNAGDNSRGNEIFLSLEDKMLLQYLERHNFAERNCNMKDE